MKRPGEGRSVAGRPIADRPSGSATRVTTQQDGAFKRVVAGIVLRACVVWRVDRRLLRRRLVCGHLVCGHLVCGRLLRRHLVCGHLGTGVGAVVAGRSDLVVGVAGGHAGRLVARLPLESPTRRLRFAMESPHLVRERAATPLALGGLPPLHARPAPLVAIALIPAPRHVRTAAALRETDAGTRGPGGGTPSGDTLSRAHGRYSSQGSGPRRDGHPAGARSPYPRPSSSRTTRRGRTRVSAAVSKEIRLSAAY